MLRASLGSVFLIPFIFVRGDQAALFYMSLWESKLQLRVRIVQTPRRPRGARPDRAESGFPEPAVRPVADDARLRGSADVRRQGQQRAGHRVHQLPPLLHGPVCWAMYSLELYLLAYRIASCTLCNYANGMFKPARRDH